jgi:hypothetical protein
MFYTRLIAILTATCLFSACATSRDSTLAGLGVGAALGAGAGAAVGQPNGNELRAGAIGAVSGAALGALMGYLAHKEDERRAAARPAPGEDGPLPALTKPVVRRVWVPDRVENNQLIRGHFIYLIEKQSEWTKTDDSKQQ